MKVETKSRVNLEPISLEITIESKEELLDLYHRLNMTPRVVHDHASGTIKTPDTITTHTWALYEVLKGIAESRGYKK